MVPAGCKGSRSCYMLWLSHTVEAQVVSYNGIIHPRSSSKRCCSLLGPRCHKQQQIFCSFGLTHRGDRLLPSLICTVPHAEPKKHDKMFVISTAKRKLVKKRHCCASVPFGTACDLSFKSLLQSQRAIVLSFHEDLLYIILFKKQ